MSASGPRPLPAPAAPERGRDGLALAGWLALSALVAFAGALASLDAADFYTRLSRPGWAPPGSLFGPVWGVLYLLMGIAAWRVWRCRARTPVAAALVLYLVQLALNALWSWLFFAWHAGAWALADIVALWLLIVATSVMFWRVERAAGLLLLPYLAWVSFATLLCWAVWQANPQALGPL